MASTKEGPDPIVGTLANPTTDPSEKSPSSEMKAQPLSPKIDKMVPATSSRDSSKNAQCQLGSFNASGDSRGAYTPNLYAPQAQAFCYTGYDNPSSEWEEYSRYLNIEGMEVGSTGAYNENPSLMFHTAFGYSPQMPYGPYSPVTTPLPSSAGHGQPYSPQQFSFTSPYYQQPVPHSLPYMATPVPVSQADLPIAVDTQGAFLGDTLNSNNMLFGPRPSPSLTHGPFGRGSFVGNSGNHGFYDMRQAYEGVGSDWLRSPEGSGSLTPLPSPVASPQPIAPLGSFEQSVAPLASGMGSRQHRASYGSVSPIGAYNRGHPHCGMYQSSNFGVFMPGLETHNRNLLAFEKGRRRGRGNASLCSCNGALDFLNEQNRGPRATRPKNPITEQSASLESKKENTAAPDHQLYNRPDFVTEYKDAKFFIIKSYSEDNVHKSIKYNVWASTANGNKKLDSAYHDAKEQGVPCPIFLFFSVNASAQFCGVAEMIGPVDFEKSVDYWQQDKWSGQFPVKWHIIKDIPNNLFRHIILENNENKPVTNSRDTQEVKLEQGLEMLNLFKDYESEMSILDDFDFYEDREKAMQDRKAKQQQQSNPAGASATVVMPVGDVHCIPVPISGDYINRMSKSFAQAVRLEGSNVENPPSDKSSLGPPVGMSE
ncbi:YTH domain-containing protein ECT4 isoform X2 [Dioscorea cayenensis subsp. rotundata]|uniref:YTH domain-containing family protein n=1 Tax=Dioscorea cayennensis subsp. rotundata TaxID=55577 RepID=A0AB40BZZ6_DIOCR|nr:YTH domain-containing protein ECT4 isoform X2 [Dioscorea cayenensis subsp. rotundata]